MKTVSFYIPNKKIKDVNLSTVHLCNPGIGGTEYTMFALCHYLSLFNDINLTVYTNCSLKGYNLRGNIVYVDNLQDALLDSKEKNIDIFVGQNQGGEVTLKMFFVVIVVSRSEN